MLLKWILAVGVLALFLSHSVLAQDEVHHVAFDGISFTFDPSIAAQIQIEQFIPDEQANPFVAAAIEFTFYSTPGNSSSLNEWRPELHTDAPGVLRISRVEDFGEWQRGDVIRLLELLETRPSLDEYMAPDARLLFLPFVPANQDIRARVEYVDIPGLSGIRYITAFGGRTFPFRSREDLIYTFQGITQDREYYVSAIFLLDTDLFPQTIPPDLDREAFASTIEQYRIDSTTRINAADPDNFSPSLSSLDAMIRSITIAGSTDVVPTPQPTRAPDEEPLWDQAVVGTTWRVTWESSYDAGWQADPFSAPTLTFTANGIRGTTGCNPYNAILSRRNGILVLASLEITTMTCHDPMSTETRFLSALYLETGIDLTFDEGRILLKFPSGSFTFDQVSSP